MLQLLGRSGSRLQVTQPTHVGDVNMFERGVLNGGGKKVVVHNVFDDDCFDIEAEAAFQLRVGGLAGA